jgi:hypothetical protein
MEPERPGMFPPVPYKKAVLKNVGKKPQEKGNR